MNAFTYSRVGAVPEAVHEIASDATAKFIAGGTNLVDLMKANVMRPSRIVDVSRLPLTKIEGTENGGLRLGALATNTEVAYHQAVETRYPLLSKAILAGASPQIRNMATVGGNLLQRTRCYYFYDTALPCNKRDPGSGCAAIPGQNRIHAILGASEHCIAVNPSDMCVALAALEAVVRVMGVSGERSIPFGDFHRLPGNAPHIDTNLQPDEIITSVDLPPRGFAERHTYLKVRDRHSYAFALVSVAAALEMEGEDIREARLVLGGVAHKPWRKTEAEALLKGKRPTLEIFQQAAEEITRGGTGYGHNNFKIELAKRAVVRALKQATGMVKQ